MSDNLKKEDLRIIRTYKFLTTALLTLLKRSKFRQITVNDLCEEALISRATFYAHFNDKYDLLNYCLTNLRNDITKHIHNFSKLETMVNQLIHNNSKIVTHLMEDANEETLELLHNFVSSAIDPLIKKTENDSKDPNYVILSNFCSGGIINLFLWQIKNKFPQDSQLMNPFFHEILKSIIESYAEQD